MTEQALGHFRVLELCSLVAGPYCTKLLGDLGAEVIKIEQPGTGDSARNRGPFLNDIPNSEWSGLFIYLNTNKLGITLDVKRKSGKDILLELIKQTDIFVEDNPPLVMEELGLKYDYLASINSRLVMTSITSYGQTGPYRDYKAYELNCWHAGGDGYLLSPQSPHPDREPVKGGGLVGECICGLSASMATLTAIYWMMITGEGQHIDISKHDVLVTMDRGELAMIANRGVTSSYIQSPRGVPNLLESADGYVLIMAGQKGQWKTVLETLDTPEWAQGEHFEKWLKGDLEDDDIVLQVKEHIRKYNKADVVGKLQGAGIVSAPVNSSEDVVNCPQFNERAFFTEIEHPEAGNLKYPTAAYKLSETPWKAQRAAPLLGQYNEQIYCDRLGYSRQELVKMRESQII